MTAGGGGEEIERVGEEKEKEKAKEKETEKERREGEGEGGIEREGEGPPIRLLLEVLFGDVRELPRQPMIVGERRLKGRSKRPSYRMERRRRRRKEKKVKG